MLIVSVYLHIMARKLKKLSIAETKKLAPTWSVKRNQLYKKFIFSNFSDAMAFMVQIGIEAEKLDHHPTINNTYNRVEIYLSTHDVGAITKLDIKLADNIDNL